MNFGKADLAGIRPLSLVLIWLLDEALEQISLPLCSFRLSSLCFCPPFAGSEVQSALHFLTLYLHFRVEPTTTGLEGQRLWA
jgi:hypothetical protein